MIQYGKYHEPLSVIIFVYSVPQITSSTVYKTKTDVMEAMNATWLHGNFTIIVFEKQIVLKGYEIRLNKNSLTKTDLGNYTFVVGNRIGKTNCSIMILEKGKTKELNLL